MCVCVCNLSTLQKYLNLCQLGKKFEHKTDMWLTDVDGQIEQYLTPSYDIKILTKSNYEHQYVCTMIHLE